MPNPKRTKALALEWSDKLKAIQTVVLVLCFSCSLPAIAAEHIRRFHSDILVNSDASLIVTETIVIRAEGHKIRRGIYRDFPTRYKSQFGVRVVVPFQALEVLRDGKREPWSTENLPNGVRINFGNDSLLPTPLETTYTFRYITARQLGFFSNYDELYWNVTGNGWEFPIDEASATVTFPQPVSNTDLHIDYYTGPQGSISKNAQADVSQSGTVNFSTTAPLSVYEGFTIKVGFPKGIVVDLDHKYRFLWWGRDHWSLLLYCIGIFALVLFYLYKWCRHGIDPRPGVIYPQYYPPAGFSAGALRYMYIGGYDNRCMAADLVQLGVQGCLNIRKEIAVANAEWTLEKECPPAGDVVEPALKGLWEDLFHSIQRVKLDMSNNRHLCQAKENHNNKLTELLSPDYLNVNEDAVYIGGTVSFLLFLLAMVVMGEHAAPASLGIAFGGLIFLVALNILFQVLLRRPTKKGRKLLDHIEGLRLYMRLASKDDISRLKISEPPLDAERFQFLLPFAVALDVEDAWTERFVGAVGIATASSAIAETGWSGVSNNFGSEIGSALSSVISSSSVSGSSSSSGGSSGGGGGGGGGGGR